MTRCPHYVEGAGVTRKDCDMCSAADQALAERRERIATALLSGMLASTGSYPEGVQWRPYCFTPGDELVTEAVGMADMLIAEIDKPRSDS